MRYSMHKFFDNYAATEQVAWISLRHPGLTQAVGDILVGVIKKPAATVPNLFEL